MEMFHKKLPANHPSEEDGSNYEDNDYYSRPERISPNQILIALQISKLAEKEEGWLPGLKLYKHLLPRLAAVKRRYMVAKIKQRLYGGGAILQFTQEDSHADRRFIITAKKTIDKMK